MRIDEFYTAVTSRIAFKHDLRDHEPPPDIGLLDSLVGEVEAAVILWALDLYPKRGRLTYTAELLGVNRTTLRTKMRLYGITTGEAP